MPARPRLFLYALIAFGGLSLITFLWNRIALPSGLRDGLQILFLFGLGALLIPLSWREFQHLRGGADVPARQRSSLLLMTLAAACFGALALLLSLGALGRVFDWQIAGMLAYGLYGFGALGLGLSIVAVSRLLLPRKRP